MKKLLILTVLAFSFLMLSCGESKNSDNSNCTENNLRCSTDKSKTEKCNANGEWIEETLCTDPEVCIGTDADTKCEAPVSNCTENNLRCSTDKSKTEKCNANGEWIEETLCTDPEVCIGADADTKCQAPSNSPSFAELSSASIILNACGIDTSITNLNDDISSYFNIFNIDEDSLIGKGYGFFPITTIKEIFAKHISCSKNNTTCSEIATCLNIELTDETCVPETYAKTCQDNKTVKCAWNGKVIKTSCAENTTCELDQGGDVECISNIEPVGCDKDTFVSSCNANVINFCEWGKEKTFNCGEDKTCQMINENNKEQASCEPNENLENCNDEDFESSCNGKYKLNCYKGKIVRNDCELTLGEGFVCKDNSSMMEIFLFAGCTHNQVATACNSTPSCQGNTLNYCINGNAQTYNCTENGYNACSTELVETQFGTENIGLCTF